jgi:hypothetical protein
MERTDHAEESDRDPWQTEVRDPAEQASEGVRTTHAGKEADASYEIAPLPDGRWAVKVTCRYHRGNCSAIGTPWVARESREACLAYFLALARDHFREEACSLVQQKAARRMNALLRGAFREPDPVPRQNEPIAQRIEKETKDRRKKLAEHNPLFADLIERGEWEQ